MKCVKLNQLCEINIGKTPSRSNSKYWGKGHKWLSIADMKSKYISETKEEITDLAVSEANMKIVPKNTVLMSFKLSIGKIGITTEEMYTNEAIASFPIIEKEKIIPEYLYYVLKTLRYDNLSDRAVMGATLNKKKLNQIVIPLPSIIVQKKIVNLLNKAEELIDKRKAQIEALDQLTQSVFLEMFGDPITNPKGWKLAICKDITSKIGSGATPKGGNASYKQQGISLIRSMNVYNNNFNYNDLAFIDEEQAEKLKNVIVNKDDILLNITGASVARSCIVPDDVLPARVNQHVSIIRVIKHLINPIFLSYTFTNEIYQKYLLRLSTSGGATREAITKKQIENLPIIIPPLDLQEQFAIKVTKIKEQKSIIQKSIGEIENLFNSLMQKAFKGELFNEEKVPNL
ncbi:hypothetical protein CHH80_21110 [Bacillus sp. 7504-2]|jgi:type I restriction enzyme, S subunit|nr:hypothetical protein CHH80_21110 [Bacillus sp. 7504-2]